MSKVFFVNVGRKSVFDIYFRKLKYFRGLVVVDGDGSR